MADPRVEKLADVLVNYSIGVKPGDWVFISGRPLALPLVKEVARLVLRAGGKPSTQMNSEELYEVLLEEASDEQLSWVSPFETLMIEKVDAMISIWSSENTRFLSSIDPKKQQLYQASRRDLFKTHMTRSAEGSLRWVGTQFPCQADAQEADMSLSKYEDFVYGATFADQPDPVRCWQEIHETQARLVDWLKGKEQLTVRGPNVDLTLSIAGRGFINSDGHKNMPSGEIFTSPVEESVNGWIKFTYPAIEGGREVDGVELEFKDGRVVKASAEKNEDYLLSQLDLDDDARIMGEFAIGTNYGIQKFTKNILFDEKIGGTIHVALGSGFPEIGGRSDSALHWDMVCDMRQDSQITVDGQLLYKDGQFQV
jgi:aminopeptidase